jgi:hypothetical protein
MFECSVSVVLLQYYNKEGILYIYTLESGTCLFLSLINEHLLVQFH